MGRPRRSIFPRGRLSQGLRSRSCGASSGRRGRLAEPDRRARLFMRCPDGVTVHGVLWKTMDGVDISLMAVAPTVAGSKSAPAAGLNTDLIRAVIQGLQ